jgi:hypothetical protein
MTVSRRDFIRGFGVALASLLATRCVKLPGFSSNAPGTNSGSARDRLRQCWLAFDWFQARAEDDYERGDQARTSLLVAHQNALDDLVAGDELAQPVANQVQAAYDEAIEHLYARRNPGVTCYTVTPTSMVTMQSRSQLLKQAELLADSRGLDPDAVAQAQAALAREMAILSLSGAALGEQLGSDTSLPDDFEIDISPEALAAAEFLTRLLLSD